MIYDILRGAGCKNMLHADASRVQTKPPKSSLSKHPMPLDAETSPPSPDIEAEAPSQEDHSDPFGIFDDDFFQVVNEDHDMLENAAALDSQGPVSKILPCDRDDLSDLDENEQSKTDVVPEAEEEHSTVALLD